MATFVRGFFLVAVLAAAVHTWSQCSQLTQGTQPASSLALTLIQDNVAAGSPLWMKITMTNISNHDISVWNGKKGNYIVEVRDYQGALAADTKFGYARNGHADPARLTPKDMGGSGACVPLKPGASIGEQVNVGRLYDLSEPGKYTIQVQRPDPENAAVNKSNTVTATVTP